MKIKTLLYSVVALGVFAGAVSAQTAVTKAAPKFTSVYSNLNRDCRTIHSPNGTDDASI